MNRDSDREVVLLDGVRTPHGVLLGSLSGVAAVDLATVALDGLSQQVPTMPSQPDWVVLGNAIQAGIGQVPARQAVVSSDELANETPVTTVNEASGSGLRAITLGVDRIRAGRASHVVAGGFESMSNAPWILPDYRSGRRYGDVTLKDSMILDSLWDVNLDVHMGEITERLVDRVSIDREAMDQYALESHRWAATAIETGVFDDEIVPVEMGADSVSRDEGPRPESTIEDLSELAPAFRSNGTITAGNASKLSDGAGAVLLANRKTSDDLGVDPLARVSDYQLCYRAPDEFNEAVGDAIEELLETNRLTVADIDAFWINEAFAAQSVYVMDRLDIPRERMNPLGGAIAFGHPIGASGGMLMTSLAYQLQRESLDRGIVGMSVGGGGAIMALLERI